MCHKTNEVRKISCTWTFTKYLKKNSSARLRERRTRGFSSRAIKGQEVIANDERKDKCRSSPDDRAVATVLEFTAIRKTQTLDGNSLYRLPSI